MACSVDAATLHELPIDELKRFAADLRNHEARLQRQLQALQQQATEQRERVARGQVGKTRAKKKKKKGSLLL